VFQYTRLCHAHYNTILKVRVDYILVKINRKCGTISSYMEINGAVVAAMGGYFRPMSPVTVFLVLASLPFAEKSKRT
jgi:hypothetical protein